MNSRSHLTKVGRVDLQTNIAQFQCVTATRLLHQKEQLIFFQEPLTQSTYSSKWLFADQELEYSRDEMTYAIPSIFNFKFFKVFI